jgi:tetratricopeptide (TPR) repeat protein
MTPHPPAAPRLEALRPWLIIAAGLLVFAPALRGDWLMDDDFYLTQNALLHDPHRLWKIWFAPGSLIEYYPVEATLQAVQWHFWHLNTVGYHLTNLILHLVNALLVWRLLARFHLRLAWLGGLLFAVHPAMVESVAWISEFKNALSLAPFLLALDRWISFEEEGRMRDYLLALGWFVLAMLCKIAMAPFPLVILLYAWWRRGRVGLRDGWHAAPFFVVSLVLGVTTILVGAWFREAHLQPAANPDIGGPLARLALAGQSLAFYFGQSLWPVHVCPVPVQWPVRAASFVSYLPWLALGLAVTACWSRRATWGRHALLGIGFFVINLLPFIGLTSVSYMTFTWVMDHFLYLPMLGLIGLAVAALEQLIARIPAAGRTWTSALIGAGLGLLTVDSSNYAAVFAGPQQLWSYTLAHNPRCWLAHNNLGDVYLETGRAALAVNEYESALAVYPASVEARTNLGFADELLGRTGDAVDQYETVLSASPHFALAQAHLAHVLELTGSTSEAIFHYQEALRANPNDAGSRAALARLLNRKAAKE